MKKVIWEDLLIIYRVGGPIWNRTVVLTNVIKVIEPTISLASIDYF